MTYAREFAVPRVCLDRRALYPFRCSDTSAPICAARALFAAPGDLLTQQAWIDGGEIDRCQAKAAILGDAVAARNGAARNQQRQAGDDRSATKDLTLD
jgi:hypothetical protein